MLSSHFSLQCTMQVQYQNLDAVVRQQPIRQFPDSSQTFPPAAAQFSDSLLLGYSNSIVQVHNDQNSKPGKVQQLRVAVRSDNKKDGYRQQNVRQRQKLISIIDYDDVCMTFYQSAIVTIALSCTICELFDVE